MSEAGEETDNKWILIFGILKLGRLLRLNKIIQFLKAAEDIKASLSLIKILLFLFVYFHCYTCVYWLTVSLDMTWFPYNPYLLKGFDGTLYDKSIEFRYLLCLNATVL